MLVAPVLLADKTCPPIAVFWTAVVVASSAYAPSATFNVPVVSAVPAL